VRIRLLAATTSLLAAGAAVIGVAGVLAVRGSLLQQADQQLRGYAGGLASRPFVVTPFSGVGPGGFGAVSARGGGYGVDVLGSAGQLVLRTGQDGRSGQVIPPVPARTTLRPGRLTTVAAAGGTRWRVIAEPIRYRARRIPFGYSAADFALIVTGQGQKGLAGTLVVGLDLHGVDQDAGRLGVITLVLTGLALLVAGWLSILLVRRITGLPGPRCGRVGQDGAHPARVRDVQVRHVDEDPHGPARKAQRGRDLGLHVPQRQVVEIAGVCVLRPEHGRHLQCLPAGAEGEAGQAGHRVGPLAGDGEGHPAALGVGPLGQQPADPGQLVHALELP
jgi:hypothetical protein